MIFEIIFIVLSREQKTFIEYFDHMKKRTVVHILHGEKNCNVYLCSCHSRAKNQYCIQKAELAVIYIYNVKIGE